jgi:hypothetical protein
MEQLPDTYPPHFPEFKSIDFEDKDIFNSFIKLYEPYSDFNFNSFYSWDTNSQHQISQLKNNLVLRLADYVTGKPFYSIIGTNEIDTSLEELLVFSERQGLEPVLKLVPEVTIQALCNISQFKITEDLDNFDYIFLIKDLAELKGKQYKSKRRLAKKCEEENRTDIIDMSNSSNMKASIIEVLTKWEQSKLNKGKDVDLELELKAVSRVMDHLQEQESMMLTTASIDNDLVGFSIDELLPNQFVLSHYFKALPDIIGLSEYLNKKVAINLRDAGYQLWNWEQDLGIESLRTMKLSHRPIQKHKKFIVLKK